MNEANIVVSQEEFNQGMEESSPDNSIDITSTGNDFDFSKFIENVTNFVNGNNTEQENQELEQEINFDINEQIDKIDNIQIKDMNEINPNNNENKNFIRDFSEIFENNDDQINNINHKENIEKQIQDNIEHIEENPIILSDIVNDELSNNIYNNKNQEQK